YGIDYRTPCFAIYKAGSYGKHLGKSFDSLSEFTTLADEVQALGGDFIKIMVTGIMDFNRYGVLTHGALSLEELDYIVKYSHDRGFAVMAHCNGARNIKNALLCGCDSIEHGYYIDGECVDIMAQTRAVWVPTVAPVANLIGSGSFSDDVLGKIVHGHYDSINKAAAAGCIIAPGSDAGSGSTYPESCTAQEYNYLLSNTQISAAGLDAGAERIKETFKRR
ncbi:MAG: Xaa-Pro dipeptidase, partial [Oscillospiraceae bacterium]|nr:Xaa-Pro dipeptidase [Oscillospiraceae bacterium]